MGGYFPALRALSTYRRKVTFHYILPKLLYGASGYTGNKRLVVWEIIAFENRKAICRERFANRSKKKYELKVKN
jgi:hypothetical protein